MKKLKFLITHQINKILKISKIYKLIFKKKILFYHKKTLNKKMKRSLKFKK